MEPRSRAYFEAFTFIKKNKEKQTTFGSDLSFSFRGTAYTRKVLLYPALSAVFILFFSPLHSSDSLEWEQKLDLQPVSPKALRIWKRFRRNYSVSLRNPLVFLSSSSYDFAVYDSLFGAYQRTFPKAKRNLGRETADYICTVAPSTQNNSDHSPVRLRQCRPHLNKKSPRCSAIVTQPTVCCLFTWTLDRGSPGSATIFTLEQTEPGSNQTISTAGCHSLSSSFHSGHIRFLFQRH